MDLSEIDKLVEENEAKKKDIDLESTALKKLKKRLEKEASKDKTE